VKSEPFVLRGWAPGYEMDYELKIAIAKGEVSVHYNEKENRDYLKGSYIDKHGVVRGFK
jgi:hypothetical protein